MNEVTIRILRVDRKELGEFRLQNIELFFKDMDMVLHAGTFDLSCICAEMCRSEIVTRRWNI